MTRGPKNYSVTWVQYTTSQRIYRKTILWYCPYQALSLTVRCPVAKKRIFKKVEKVDSKSSSSWLRLPKNPIFSKHARNYPNTSNLSGMTKYIEACNNFEGIHKVNTMHWIQLNTSLQQLVNNRRHRATVHQTLVETAAPSI